MTRQRDVAQILVDEFGRGSVLDLAGLVGSGRLDQVAIYEAGFRGPIAARLKQLPRYVQSYFWEDVQVGEIHNGIRCEDLTRLTLEDASVDVMISLEVLEHVFNVHKALKEVSRILRPSGIHIFSVPVRYPLPPSSLHRARLENGQIVHMEGARYHVAGDGSRSLVVTDFGEDLIDMHRAAGLDLRIVRRSAPNFPELQNATFLARKNR